MDLDSVESAITFSSKPSSRRPVFLDQLRLEAALPVTGTSISTGPLSVCTGLRLCPLLPQRRSGGSCPKCPHRPTDVFKFREYLCRVTRRRQLSRSILQHGYSKPLGAKCPSSQRGGRRRGDRVDTFTQKEDANEPRLIGSLKRIESGSTLEALHSR